MVKNIVLVTLLFFVLTSSAQSSGISVKTEVGEGRFEIIQCPITRKFTIKLDKETGETWMLVKGHDDIELWQKLSRIVSSDKRDDGKNNYMIFMGGITAKDIYLVNVHTGQTWQLVHDLKEDTYWWSLMVTL